MTTTKTGPFFEVPPKTRETACRSCEAPIYWIVTTAGKRMPVDCEANEECHPPTDHGPGLGLSHFATCPQGNTWRRER
jgi:hypothetical protein